MLNTYLLLLTRPDLQSINSTPGHGSSIKQLQSVQCAPNEGHAHQASKTDQCVTQYVTNTKVMPTNICNMSAGYLPNRSHAHQASKISMSLIPKSGAHKASVTGQ